MKNRFIATVILSAVMVAPAWSKASDWVETSGAQMRIVMVPFNENAESVEGILEIRLEPGWKTYWIEPGDGGIPPMLGQRVSGDAKPVDLHFPVPSRLHAQGLSFAGYETGVQFPFSVDRATIGMDGMLQVEAFIGVCSDVCVPFQAEFDVETARADESGSPSVERLALAVARSKLPQPAETDPTVDPSGSTLTVTFSPSNGWSDLFLVNDAGHAFGEARSIERGVFEVPHLREGSLPAEIRYLVRDPEGAGFSGTILLAD